MEPYDKVCLSNDMDYFCFPCGTLKLRNEPRPLFNPTVESSIGGSGRGGGGKNGNGSNGGGNDSIRGGAEEKNGNVSISRSKNEGKSTGKLKLELCYAENNPQCAICKDYI